MNIWILNHYALPPDSAGGTRHFDLARRLVAQGHDVTIIAANTAYMTGQSERIPRGYRFARQLIEGVRFVWVRARPYHGNGLTRLLNMVDYARHVRQVARHLPRPSVLVGVAIHHFTGLAAWDLARHYRVPFVFEVGDIWPDTLVDMGISPRHPAVLLFNLLDRFLLRRADHVITLLPLSFDRLAQGGAPRERITLIPNGFDLGRFPLHETPPSTAHFTAMYAGSHGSANGLETLIRAAQLLSVDPDPVAQQVRLLLVGDGPEKAKLEALAVELNVHNVSFEAAVPKAAIAATLQQADALIFHLQALAVLVRFGLSPNKLWDYMAAARPVIFACIGGNNPIQEAGAGLSIAPERPAALAHALVTLARMPPAERQRMGLAGRSYVERHHDWDALTEQFLAVLQYAVEMHR